MPVYVITGANRGLGLEFATQISTDTTNTIIGTTRTLTSDLSEFNALKAHNKNIHILECDTGSISSIQAFAKQLSKLLGENGNKIDFLLNNAGINSVPHERSTSISEQGLQDQIRINVLGPAKTVEFLDAAGLLGKGSVVMNISSGLGSVTLAKESVYMAKSTTYGISKAALNMLTVHQSAEFKEKGVVVICMDPGWVKTRMGGENAALEKELSIGGMLKVIRGVGEADSGKFFEYNGKERPW